MHHHIIMLHRCYLWTFCVYLQTGYLGLVAASLIARTYCDVWMIHNGTSIERWASQRQTCTIILCWIIWVALGCSALQFLQLTELWSVCSVLWIYWGISEVTNSLFSWSCKTLFLAQFSLLPSWYLTINSCMNQVIEYQVEDPGLKETVNLHFAKYCKRICFGLNFSLAKL